MGGHDAGSCFEVFRAMQGGVKYMSWRFDVEVEVEVGASVWFVAVCGVVRVSGSVISQYNRVRNGFRANVLLFWKMVRIA